MRMLKPRGNLVDLRPLAANSPIKVVTEQQSRLAVRIDDSRDCLDDRAADGTVSQILRNGWFVRKREETFDYIASWDILEEMQIYIEERGQDSAMTCHPNHSHSA